MPDEPTIPNATCPPFAGASARDLLAGILLASGGDPANIPNTTQCREWGYGRYTERDLLAAILLATGTGGSAAWGSITGTLSSQTDLQTALNGKLGVSAQAADVNPAGTAIAAALGAKLNLTGGTLSGALNFSGTTHAGIRLNNLTTVERDAVASPLAGMVLWNTTTSRINVHNGSAWTDGFVRLGGDAMTGALSVTLTGLGTTPTAGLTLVNSTDAGLGAQQVSPSFVLEGRGYRSTTSVGSQIVRFRQSVLPVQGVSASPTATWRLQSEINNSSTWVDNLFVTSAGLISSGGSNNIFLGTDPYITQVNSGRPIDLRMAGGSVTITDASATGPRLAFSPTNGNTSPDRVFGSNTSNSFYFGVAGSTPAAQTLGVAAGVGTNIAGANFTLTAGLATGNANGGSLLFQTSTVGSSGSTLQTLTTRLTIDATGLLTIASGSALRLGNAAVAATPTPTHTLTLQDSTGTTYRIPCVV